MTNNLTTEGNTVRGMYTLGVNDPNKLYFTSDT